MRIDNGIQGQVYSTDGHILFACRFDIENQAEVIKGIFDIIIPIEAVMHDAKGKTPKVDLVSLDNGEYMLDGMRFAAIDGVYPDVARVLPNTSAYTPEPGDYDPELLVRCDKALKAWFDLKPKNKGSIKLHQNGLNSAMMQGPDNTGVCVIMPLRAPDQSMFSFTVINKTA